ncbi:hypothetical protein JNUCC31_23785 [Paenibacillus sp. JNUCC31]|uniref:hypothetical protein n=1 Tax=Paenibacillus sp. JNUCC-31 TaxID=2777983 RepID=UPI00177A9049|nr:hypothetical protein [Paenibacillus sp. JNUCC-31]QOS77750.1 hypothetical protein JNUCC31_23785 [Paenibacillus sp. JNUCC-31]
MKVFIALVVCLSLYGCQSLEEDKAMMNGWEGSPKLEKQEASLFSTNISAPKKVKCNEMFTVIGDFDVKSNQKLQIVSREKLFTFLVKDSSGRQINSSFVTDAGKIREVSGKTTISENFNYKIKEPGSYEISAVAEFTITKSGKASNYTIKTNTQRIEVIEDEQ